MSRGRSNNQPTVFNIETSWWGILVDSGAQLHSCPNIQHREYHCFTLESTQRVELVSNIMEVVWKDSNYQDEQSECFFMRAMFKKHHSFRSDLRVATGRTQHSHTQLHKEDRLSFVEGMLMAPPVTAGVSDDVAQELQMPSGPQALEDVENRCHLVQLRPKIQALVTNYM